MGTDWTGVSSFRSFLSRLAEICETSESKILSKPGGRSFSNPGGSAIGRTLVTDGVADGVVVEADVEAVEEGLVTQRFVPQEEVAREQIIGCGISEICDTGHVTSIVESIVAPGHKQGSQRHGLHSQLHDLAGGRVVADEAQDRVGHNGEGEGQGEGGQGRVGRDKGHEVCLKGHHV